MTSDAVKRVYDNRHRTEQAGATRHRVLLAARELFLTRGYSPVSMSAIAATAGVSREMLYKVFGSKSALAKAVYDTTLAGDEADVAIAERPELAGILQSTDARAMISAIAAMSAELVDRLGPLMSVLLAGARAGDPDLVELTAISNAERLTGVQDFVRAIAGTGQLRAGLTESAAVDEMWMLCAPEVWQLLVDDRGWSLEQYRSWLDRSLLAALVE